MNSAKQKGSPFWRPTEADIEHAALAFKAYLREFLEGHPMLEEDTLSVNCKITRKAGIR